MINKGVLESALEIVGNQATSTYEEAVGLRDWTATNSAVKSLIIVTDLFHTRRCGWLFRRQLKSAGVRIQLAGVTNPDYSGSNWWRHETGLIAFQNELVKLPYYRLKY